MSAKKIDFKKIALIGGGLWIGNKLLTKDPATVQAFSAASLGSGNVSDIEALKTLIKTDPQIRALLKGDTGATGDEGAAGGPAGDKGLDGLNAPTRSGSLLPNGAFENGTNGWSLPSGFSLLGERGGFPILQNLNTSGYAINSNFVYSVKERLQVIEVDVKAAESGLCFIAVYPRKLNGQASSTADFGDNFGVTTSWNRVKHFLGQTKLSDDTAKFQIGLFAGALTTEFNALAVRTVDLGEPVPYTLPWLPAGQMIYDPATGDVGRWDGTVETWFATTP